jgi:hypothetical protein
MVGGADGGIKQALEKAVETACDGGREVSLYTGFDVLTMAGSSQWRRRRR